jgi:hypothetical protein
VRIVISSHVRSDLQCVCSWLSNRIANMDRGMKLSRFSRIDSSLVLLFLFLIVLPLLLGVHGRLCFVIPMLSLPRSVATLLTFGSRETQNIYQTDFFIV